jgi:hypothetical protein
MLIQFSLGFRQAFLGLLWLSAHRAGGVAFTLSPLSESRFKLFP